jgi:hypothetical protein
VPAAADEPRRIEDGPDRELMPADVIQLAGDAVRPLLEHASREKMA